jgi:hypothetical protein
LNIAIRNTRDAEKTKTRYAETACAKTASRTFASKSAADSGPGNIDDSRAPLRSPPAASVVAVG